jgi:hypothetical protein
VSALAPRVFGSTLGQEFVWEVECTSVERCPSAKRVASELA